MPLSTACRSTLHAFTCRRIGTRIGGKEVEPSRIRFASVFRTSRFRKPGGRRVRRPRRTVCPPHASRGWTASELHRYVSDPCSVFGFQRPLVRSVRPFSFHFRIARLRAIVPFRGLFGKSIPSNRGRTLRSIIATRSHCAKTQMWISAHKMALHACSGHHSRIPQSCIQNPIKSPYSQRAAFVVIHV